MWNASRAPADIDFGVKVSIPVMGTLGVSEPLTPPPDRSWVTMEGLLTCSETPSAPRGATFR
jgi:hypothetical protein